MPEHPATFPLEHGALKQNSALFPTCFNAELRVQHQISNIHHFGGCMATAHHFHLFRGVLLWRPNTHAGLWAHPPSEATHHSEKTKLRPLESPKHRIEIPWGEYGSAARTPLGPKKYSPFVVLKIYGNALPSLLHFTF